jgi:hypothetical protein
MKKQFLAAAVMVLLPLTASASDSVGSAKLQISGAGPWATSAEDRSFLGYNWVENTASYQADYDIVQYGSGANLLTDPKKSETFCVSKDPLDSSLTQYSFYKSDYLGGKAAYVTWVANWATSSVDNKIVGQAAIWQSLGIFSAETDYIYEGSVAGARTYDLTSTIASLNQAYNAAVSAGTNSKYVNDWLVAVNTDTDGDGWGWCHSDTDGQDFLVKASPVPVPSTMLLRR